MNAALLPMYFDMAALDMRNREHGCRKSDICNMDHMRGYPPSEERRVNRVCVTCWRHWAGPWDQVREYTKAEWDAAVEEGFRE